MRVAFDVSETCSVEPTGCGCFTSQAVQAMFRENECCRWGDEYALYVRWSSRKKMQHGFCPSGYSLRTLSPWNFPASNPADIIHGFATHAPRKRNALRVVTLFDVFSALEESAEWQHPRSRDRKMAQYERLARTCDLIIAISETTKRDFLKHFDYPEERVRVIYGGVSPDFSPDAGSGHSDLRERYDLPERYYLYVGAPVPRKNVPRLINAYAQSVTRDRIGLVIAGSITEETSRIRERTADGGFDDRVRFIDYVPDQDFPALYACAEALLFPTFYEGFGMPVLEAMACGIPTVIGFRGAAPEIAGDYAVKVDPRDTAELCRAIERVTETSPETREQARAHAAGFTWQKCASSTREAYQWLLSEGRSSGK